MGQGQKEGGPAQAVQGLEVNSSKSGGLRSDCASVFDLQVYWGSRGLRHFLSGQASGQMLTSWFRSGRRGAQPPRRRRKRPVGDGSRGSVFPVVCDRGQQTAGP